MAAIITSQPNPRPMRPGGVPGGPHLVVLEGGRSRQQPAAPSPAVLRRRRLVAAAVLVMFVAVAVVGIRAGLGTVITPPVASGPTATGEAGSAPGATMTVEAGDTLWSIARELRPSGQVRPVVDELVAANGSQALRPGQEIHLPAEL